MRSITRSINAYNIDGRLILLLGTRWQRLEGWVDLSALRLLDDARREVVLHGERVPRDGGLGTILVHFLLSLSVGTAIGEEALLGVEQWRDRVLEMLLSAAESLQDFFESHLLALIEQEADAGLRARDVELHSQWLGTRLRNETRARTKKKK